ncbi:unnamed protein product [Pedinophyceae sp. YPF-701]|nr:unnamed protein product [Pedinophyceae sp. YPF-701]
MNTSGLGLTQLLDTAWEPLQQEAMKKCMALVYKTRIRIQDFFKDFDPLRSGLVSEAQFLRSLSSAGIDRHLPMHLFLALPGPFLNEEGKVSWSDFCARVNLVFTMPGLEKDPLAEVPPEPVELLDKTRYQKSSKELTPEQEALVEKSLEYVKSKCARRGVPVKPFFDDFARNKNSPCLVGHVTAKQFEQTLNVALGLDIDSESINALVAKYANEDKPEMINYFGFSATVDPSELTTDPDTLYV